MVRRVTGIGLVLNVLLSIVKFIGGIIGNSQAVVADAVHSLSDTTTDIAVLVGLNFWSRPPDADHHYGHRRIETMISILIGVVLALVGISIGWNALRTLHTPHSKPPEWIAVIVALISIVLKEGLYQWTIKTGKSIKSYALIANAWHHRSDAFSSIPVVIAVGGAIIFPTWIFLDHVGAVIVSIFILQAAYRIVNPGMKELIDSAAPAEVCDQIRKIAEGVEGVSEIHDLRTRYIGSRLQADLHVVVKGTISVADGHEIAENVKRKILEEGPDVIDVIVFIEPL